MKRSSVILMSISILGLSLAAYFFGVNVVNKPASLDYNTLQIADMKDIDLDFSKGKAVLGKGDIEVVKWIKTEDASFIKVHFDYFKLPQNAYVEVSSPNNEEVYRYYQDKRDNFTVDGSLNEDGYTSFAAMSITGNIARIKLVRKKDNWDPSLHGILITRYMEGHSTQTIIDNSAQHESTCGENERKDVSCFKDNYPGQVERSRPVARLLMRRGMCTAWRVGPTNTMVTNNHCIANQYDTQASEVWFNYQNTECGRSTIGTVVKVPADKMLETSARFDFTLFTVKDFSSIASFGYLGLEVRAPKKGERIYIPQHGGGKPKQLAITSDVNRNGFCQIDEVDSGVNAGYRCDTTGGSSGSPVLAQASNRAIALHHLGGCPSGTNMGVQFSNIWPSISNHFGGAVPSGDNDYPDKEPPKPSPLTWDMVPNVTEPTSISMKATVAQDVSGVQYYFECMSPGCHSSGWQDDVLYVDGELKPNTTYTYRVKARDLHLNHNETEWSIEATATTPISPLVAKFGYKLDKLTVSFSDQSFGGEGEINSWEWQFGDGNTSNERSPVHVYAEDGNYDVTLKIATSVNENATVSKTIAVDSSPPPYCKSFAKSDEWMWIGKISMGDLSHNSTGSTYSDYTSYVVHGKKGQSYEITLDPGYKQQKHRVYYRVWIDFNRDGDFFDTGEQVYTSSKTMSANIGTIEIPTTAISGKTRMRVTQKYAMALPQPCDKGFNWGEVEDYTLMIDD